MTRKLFLLLVLACSSLANAQPSVSNTPALKVLFIGNSYLYADDIPSILVNLANFRSKKIKLLEVESIATAGASLKSHWQKAEAVNRLRSIKWDYVVLQEQSMRPIEAPGEFRRYAQLFDNEIKMRGAKTVLFLTWPRQQHPEHLAALTNAYFELAKDLNAQIAPVGVAWSTVLNSDPSVRLFHQDGSHPGPVGSYLASCVMYSVLFQKSPVGLPRTLFTVGNNGSHVKPGELNKAAASLIQRTAWQCVQNTKQSGSATSKTESP